MSSVEQLAAAALFSVLNNVLHQAKASVTATSIATSSDAVNSPCLISSSTTTAPQVIPLPTAERSSNANIPVGLKLSHCFQIKSYIYLDFNLFHCHRQVQFYLVHLALLLLLCQDLNRLCDHLTQLSLTTSQSLHNLFNQTLLVFWRPWPLLVSELKNLHCVSVQCFLSRIMFSLTSCADLMMNTVSGKLYFMIASIMLYTLMLRPAHWVI